MEKVQLNILLCCDSKVSKYIPALMNSIYKNHEDHFVNIYLMFTKENPIDPRTLTVLSEFARNSEMSEFNPIAVSKKDFFYFENLDNVRLGGAFPLETYLYFLCHKYLPANVNRILKLDIDTIVNDDIYDFYTTDFKDKYLTVLALDSNVDHLKETIESLRERDDFDLKIAARGGYFNPGVMLINVEKLRNENIDIEFYKVYLENTDHAVKFLADQGIVNYIFCDKCNYIMDETLNFRLASIVFDYTSFNFTPMSKVPFQNIDEMSHIRIMHYNYRPKGWDGAFFPDSLLNTYIIYNYSYQKTRKLLYSRSIKYLFSLFNKYAHNAPFYEEIKEEAKVKSTVMLASYENLLGQQRFEVFANAFRKQSGLKNEHFKNCSNLIVNDVASFNPDAWEMTIEEKSVRYSTKYYIKDQWLVFPLVENLNLGTRYRLKIKFATNRIKKKINCYLSNQKFQGQHNIFSSTKENEIQEFITEFVTNKSDYMALCFNSNSFANKGDSITIYDFNLAVIE